MDQTELDFRVREHCLDRLAILGYRACNACLGESMRFEHATPITIDARAA